VRYIVPFMPVLPTSTKAKPSDAPMETSGRATSFGVPVLH
jgi:hypothetical protein